MDVVSLFSYPLSEYRGRLKNPIRLAIWLTILLAQSGITVAIPRRNHTGFPINFPPLRRASRRESEIFFRQELGKGR